MQDSTAINGLASAVHNHCSHFRVYNLASGNWTYRSGSYTNIPHLCPSSFRCVFRPSFGLHFPLRIFYNLVA